MEILALKLDTNFPKKDFLRLLKCLDNITRLNVSKFINYEDSLRSCFAELMMRMRVMTKLNIKNNDILLRRNANGKPYIDNNIRVFYNISHSCDYIVCGIDNQELGIDIERICECNLNVAGRFFSNVEYEHFLSLRESERLEYFYILWTFKESYLKAIGKGLSYGLDSFSVIKKDNKFSVYLNGEYESWFLKQISFDDQYKIALCTKREYPEYILKVYTMKEVYDFFTTLC